MFRTSVMFKNTYLDSHLRKKAEERASAYPVKQLDTEVHPRTANERSRDTIDHRNLGQCFTRTYFRIC